MAVEDEAMIAIDMIGDCLVSSMKQQLAALGDDGPDNFTIFRVPAHIRQVNKQMYEPQVVSVGPYHNGNPAFEAMQEAKWRYLRDLLARDRCNCIEGCIDALKALEPQARQCYFEPVKIDADEFVKMLLLDGCFVVEFLMKWRLDKKKDAACITAWSLPLIRCDLLLLDNQIPFFVIESLFDLLVARSCTAHGISSLTELLVTYVTRGKKKELPAAPAQEKEPCKQIQHLLHVYHLCFVRAQRPTSSAAGNLSIAKWAADGSLLSCFRRSNGGEKRWPRTIPCATELQEAGVTIKMKKKKKEDRKNKKEADNSGSFMDMDITFRNGVLEIPFLSVEDSARSRFANLVAFEQCMGAEEANYMTSYACFMDCVINTARDVAILHESGIIENKLPSDEELASFFNRLCDGTSMDYENHYLAPLFREVREHCDSKWPRWRAKLMKDYFGNPWAIFSLVAAVTLLVFAFLQTFFTIFPYFHPNSHQ